MGKQNDACVYLSTTGAGIAVGSGGIDLYGWIRGSALAGSITIKDSATVICVTCTADPVILATPLALNGPVTMTSSAGDHYLIFYRKRNV
jgi:hypothetical protein